MMGAAFVAVLLVKVKTKTAPEGRRSLIQSFRLRLIASAAHAQSGEADGKQREWARLGHCCDSPRLGIEKVVHDDYINRAAVCVIWTERGIPICDTGHQYLLPRIE